MKTLEDIIFETLENCGRPKGAVATDMGIPLSTLSRESSPYDAGAKFGASSLVPFMKATNSIAPLLLIADAMGLKVIPKNGKPDSGNLQQEVVQGYEATGEYLKAANDKNMHYTKLASLRMRADKELDDVFVVARERDMKKGLN